MSGVNKAIILGNLGADPEVRHTQAGKAIANLRVATSESWKGQDGSKQEKTTWHRAVCFGRTAEVAGQYLSKGSKVYIEGKLATRKWQDQSGNDRYSTEVALQGFDGKLVMLDTRGGGGAGLGGGSSSSPVDSGGYGGGDMEDEIPFAPEFR